MKDYQVELVSEGAITQIPDSQKVFGALVYLFAEQYSGQEATRLTKAILNREIHFILSSVMPSGYLPTPQEYLMDKLNKSSDKDSDMKLKEQYSLIKERSYIKADSLERIISEKSFSASIFPYVSVEVRQQLRASIDSVRYNIPELESKLYSIPTVNLTEVSQCDDKKMKSAPINKFQFYFQTGDSELEQRLVKMLEQAAADKQSIVLGKRASQSMNLFQINALGLQKRVIERSDLYLNLGMLLPDNIDFSTSTIKLFTSERRPFDMPGGWHKDFEKKYISFIAEGSMIGVKNGIKNTGKSIVSPFNKARDIVFGNAYLYPLSTAER